MVRPFLIFLFALLSSTALAEQASWPPHAEAATPAAQTVQDFYAWYNGECSKKTMDYLCADTPQGRHHVHSALRQWLKAVRETETGEMEGEKAPDYFWQAQDSGAFEVTPKYAHQALVTVQFEPPLFLLVTLKDEEGKIKIIRVENVTH